MVRLDNKQEVIEYFKNEIIQYELIIRGNISQNYHKYIEKKLKCYKIALSTIKESR